jgi:hypothetical protein
MADYPEATRCRSCRAPIRFLPTPAGKSLPVDAEPEKRVVVNRHGQAVMWDTFTPHWATCAAAAEHRKPK